MEDTKRCSKCGREQPITEFYLERRVPEKRFARCKSCGREMERQARARNVALNPDVVDTPEWKTRTKRCPKCRLTLHFTEFVRHNGGKNGLGKYCRKCARQSPEKIRARNRTIPYRYSGFKRQATRRGIDVRITLEEFQSKITGQSCHYCGGILTETGCSLDRMGNERYYSTENTVPCCTECNRIKSDKFTYDEMVVLGSVIRRLLLGRNRVWQSATAA